MHARWSARSCFSGLIMLLALVPLSCGHEPQTPDFRLVNFARLESLCRPLRLASGDTVIYLHYQTESDGHTPAAEQNYGVGTVDDAARALLVFLRWFELTGDTTHLPAIRGLASFICAMQTPQGRWRKWIRADGTPGGGKDEAEAAFGNTAAKAIWALGRLEEVFRGRRPEMLAGVPDALEIARRQFEACLGNYPEVERLDGVEVPRWLPNGGNGDVASEMLLGLSALRRAGRSDPSWDEVIEKLAEALGILQQKNPQAFAYGVHFSFKQAWHAWSNAQVQALAEVYALTKRPETLASARREADNFYPWLLEQQFADHFDWLAAKADAHAVVYFPQRVEHVRPVVLGALSLYRVTGEQKYARLAGEAGCWLLGENAAHEVIYDPITGGAKSYMQSRNYVVPLITGEATAEALLILIELGATPAALRFVE